MFTHHRSISITLLLLYIFNLSPAALSIRKDVSLLPKHICRTTVQGRYYLTDDNGYVCDGFSVDPLTRCCPGRGDKFSCQGCNVVSQCCNSYEFCVSCCLNPDMTRRGLALKVKILKPMSAGMYGSVFDYCAGRCRHNSESVVHENAYLSEFHHCFSIPSNSSGSSSTQVEARLAGINIIIGRQGESCDSVCKSNGQSCVPNKLALLNQCDVGCNVVSQCCNSYEFCVSCCLNPDMTRRGLALKVKIAKPMSAGMYGSVFDYCAGRCRHNSESVVHENAYLSEFHHCFSIPSNSSGSSSTQVEARLAGINIIIGRQGESCDSVCKSNGQSCVPNKLALLNQCDVTPAHACTREDYLHFLVMVHTLIQGDFVRVHKLGKHSQSIFCPFSRI